jgi:hypothetical protein
MAQLVHHFKLFNDMPSRIVSFTVSPAGSQSAAKLDFDDPERPFDYGAAAMIDVRGGSWLLVRSPDAAFERRSDHDAQCESVRHPHVSAWFTH